MKEGGITIEHNGAAGAIMARMHISEPNKGYSSVMQFTDPTTAVSSKMNAGGLRIGSIGSDKLEPVVVARNIGNTLSWVKVKLPYTDANGNVQNINVPQRLVLAGKTTSIDLRPYLLLANLPASIKFTGIEVEYTTAPGTVLLNAVSPSKSGKHVYPVPLMDPQRMPSSAGGFPWKVDGDYNTIVYIKNETDTLKKITANLLYPGGGYGLGVTEVKAGQTIAIDFKKLRNDQTPDVNGSVIPMNLETGQIAWSVIGADNRTMSGRSEQVNEVLGIASTYACYNCCPNGFNDAWIEAFQLYGSVGVTESFMAMQNEVNCFGTTLSAFPVTWASIYSNNTAIADFTGGNTVEAFAPGSTTIEASWETGYYSMEGVGYDECYWVPVYLQPTAPVEVTNPVPSISEVTLVEKHGLTSVTIGVTGAGAQDTTKFRLRLVSGTGNATFEDSTTEKSYTGNLSQTELKIKGITESSAVGNYVIEALVNDTLHQASAKNFTIAAITALEFERINTTGGSPDVPFDNNPGTDGTHTAEEGLRIFPDKNTPGDNTDRATIRVKATIAPANVPNLNVYFASFDVDDPSANVTPIDTNGSDGNDNNGHVNNSKSGEFSTAIGVSCTGDSTGSSPLHISKIACPVSNNTTSANFKVTMQPGDNFAVAASLISTYRDSIRVSSSAGANLINSASQIIPISGESNPNNVQGIRTKMLTVWRRLHIEVDSMGTVSGNDVSGNFNGSQNIASSGNTTLNVTVTNPLEINRFENGRLVVTSVNPNQSFNVIDHTSTATANTTNSVTVRGSGSALNITNSDTFVLYDDDDMDDNDVANLNGDAGDDVGEPDFGLLTSDDTACPNTFNANNCNVFLNAYVRPVAGLATSYEDVGFNTNVTLAEIATLRTTYFQNRTHHERDDIWAIYVLGLYQGETADDGDPDGSSILWGEVDSLGGTGEGAWVFLEPSRPTEWNILDVINCTNQDLL